MKMSSIIPFYLLPMSWGLRGKTREIRKAEYELEGYNLELRLLELNENDADVRKKLKLDLDFKYNKISNYDRDLGIAMLDSKNEKESKLIQLDVDFKHEKITKDQYDRQRADLLNEPWVSMPQINWDPINNGKTYFTLDYNNAFLEQLKSHGYTGEEEEIINTWMNDVCISIIEEINGLEAEYITPSKRIDSEE